MRFCSRVSLRYVLPLAAVFIISACTEGNRPVPLSDVNIAPPLVVPPQSNVNIANPTLTVEENEEVSFGGPLTLVWSDEFDGAQLDPEVWFFATGDGDEFNLPPGWGNNELQYYLPDNAQLVNGNLVITAREDEIGGFQYSSARINTRDRFAFKYGRIEASMRLPAGQGIWPAFWMLAQSSPYGSWAATGEIDVMEAVNLGGAGGNTVFGTLHFGGEFPNNVFESNDYVVPTDVTTEFHTYAVEWDEREFRWYVDDVLYATQTTWYSTAAEYPAPFDQPFYVLFNVAVGGNLPGIPDTTTVFPATMEVDWVRVYSGEEGPGGGVDPGTTPDQVVYSSDVAATPDLPPPGGIQDFGSGAVIVDVLDDPDFTQVLSVTSGSNYDPGNVQVGFAAFAGYMAGFAAGFETLEFKVKGDIANLNNFEVKFFGPDDSQVYDLTTYAGSTALGNGWYQVSVPLSDFNAAQLGGYDGFLLGPFGDQANTQFTFFVTGVGFSGTVGGGGVDPGTTPDQVVYSSDMATMPDLPPPGGIQDFGSGAAIIDVFDDPDFTQVLSVTSGSNYDPGNVQVGFAAFTGYAAGFAAGFETLEFKVKGDAANLSNFEVKFFGPDDSQVYDILNYAGSTALGNGWYQVSVPLSDFNAAQLGGYDGFLLGPFGDQANTQFTFFVTGVGFSGTAGGGASITPDEAVFSSQGAGSDTLGPPGGIQDFGSGAVIVEVANDPAYARALSVTSGSNYDPGNVQVGFAAFTGYAAGFAAGFGTLDFKVKGDAANLNNFEVKFFGPDDSQVYDLTNYSGSTDLGNGWWQASIPLSDFNAAQLGGYDGFLLGPFGDQANTQFTFFVTDVGFSGTAGGGGDECVRPAAGPGVDLATNGDFETGELAPCWTEFPNGGTIAISSPGNGDMFAGNIDASGQAIGVTLKQANLGAGELTPGQTVRVTFDWKGTDAIGGVVDVRTFSELTGGGVSKEDVLLGGAGFPADWTTFGPVDITTGADVTGGFTLQFTAACGSDPGCVSNIEIDNVSIVTP